MLAQARTLVRTALDDDRLRLRVQRCALRLVRRGMMKIRRGLLVEVVLRRGALAGLATVPHAIGRQRDERGKREQVRRRRTLETATSKILKTAIRIVVAAGVGLGVLGLLLLLLLDGLRQQGALGHLLRTLLLQDLLFLQSRN